MQPCSLKEAIQSMSGEPTNLLRGVVVSTSPIQIKVENDEKIMLSDTLRIPKHLTNHTVSVSIPASGAHSQYSGDGKHSHENVTMTVNNGLVVGDVVYMIAMADNKQYLVIDRVV